MRKYHIQIQTLAPGYIGISRATIGYHHRETRCRLGWCICSGHFIPNPEKTRIRDRIGYLLEMLLDAQMVIRAQN
jgi:hypothetical protein